MKKLKPQAFNIDLHVYPYTIYVVIGNPELFRNCMELTWKKPEQDVIDGWVKTLKEHKEEGHFATTFRLESNDAIIFFATTTIPKQDPASFHNYIAHELFHAVSFVMSTIGMPLGEDSEEAYAYLLGYVTQEFYKQLKS